jgi:hypothetical protein
VTQLQFEVSNGKDKFAVDLTYLAKSGEGSRKPVPDQERYIKSAFDYIYQAPMGRALIETVCKKPITIWFYNTNAYDPGAKAVKWQPLQGAWFVDTAKSWAYRNAKKIPQPFDGNLIVRPTNRKEAQLSDTKADYVFGFHSPPAMLFHELGHAFQHMKGTIKTNNPEFMEAAKNFKKLITATVQAEDHEYPWEVDNVNWNEQTFVLDLRKLGLCEGTRWHYQDSSGTAINLENWEVVTSDGVKAVKMTLGGKAYHNCGFWNVADGKLGKEVGSNGNTSKASKVAGGIGGTTLIKPDGTALKKWWDTDGPGGKVK